MIGSRSSVILSKREQGWTLIELVITMTVMAVLSLGIIPLVKSAVQRQKEQILREELRTMREAIKEFRRDTVGMQCSANGLPNATGGSDIVQNTQGLPNQQGQQGQGGFVDPRSTVVIGDCLIFKVDNPDHYPPDLETLVKGVAVKARNASPEQMMGSTKGDFLSKQSNALATKTKRYLREIPVDPMTGNKDWVVCSSWEPQTAESCGGSENAFDVRSHSSAKALNEKDKYSDW